MSAHLLISGSMHPVGGTGLPSGQLRGQLPVGGAGVLSKQILGHAPLTSGLFPGHCPGHEPSTLLVTGPLGPMHYRTTAVHPLVGSGKVLSGHSCGQPSAAGTDPSLHFGVIGLQPVLEG